VKIVSGKRMVHILESKGWILKHIKGSHHIMVHSEYEDPISVPVHGDKDLKRGVQLNIMKDADISEDELILMKTMEPTSGAGCV
jgi:predicted RNA binding protein YcfA (HicA-like mRNA interferase family)